MPRRPKRRQPKGPDTPRVGVPQLTPDYLIDLAGRAGSVKELRLIWRNTKDIGMLTDEVRQAILQRNEELK